MLEDKLQPDYPALIAGATASPEHASSPLGVELPPVHPPSVGLVSIVSQTPREIRPLTSLRFFAAAMVFCEHIVMLPGTAWMKTDTDWPGQIGVSLFFVLSGFILNYSYGQSRWTQSFAKTARVYYTGRAARIYPLHWLMFMVALPLGLNSNTARVNLSDLPWLFFLTDKLWPGYSAGSPPVKVAWTLSCEMIFYLFLPFILLLLQRSRRVLLTSVGLLTVSTILIYTAALTWPTLNWWGYIHVPEFLLGIVGLQWYRRQKEVTCGSLLLLGGLLLLAFWVWIVPRLPIPCSAYSYSFLGFAPGSLLVILGSATVRGRLYRILSLPALVLLGNASYALYLLHDPLLRYTKVLLDRRGIVLPLALDLLVAAVLFAVCVALSIGLFWLYETPLRLKIRALFHNRATPVDVEASPLAT
jgi:peptidoglycan/LPS O-acetylase OafA/YrhL